MSRKIRIGTRKSKLAMAQTYLVVDAMKRVDPELEVSIVSLSTKGDKVLDKPLLSFGGKGVFINEFEEMIQSGEIDIAVHSAKDMPMELLDGLTICAVLEREDPRDVLITRKGYVWDREKTITVGTSSLRRIMQVEQYGKVVCHDLRGNVNTRLQKLEDGQYDAIILAMAGMKRLDLLSDERFDFQPFDLKHFIPAGGQGIIAIEGREGEEFEGLWKQMDNTASRYELSFERMVLKLLDAGCHEPIGVFSNVEGDSLTGYLMMEKVIHQVTGKKDDWEQLAQELYAMGGRKNV